MGVDDIKKILAAFKESVSNEPDAEELFSLFKEKVKSVYEFCKDNGASEEVAYRMVNSRLGYYVQMSTQDKRRNLIKDPNIDKIRHISNKVYRIAENTVHGKEFGKKIDLHKLENRLGHISGEVKDFNKSEAKRLISETLLDVNYINGKRNISSLRLASKIKAEKAENAKEK